MNSRTSTIFGLVGASRSSHALKAEAIRPSLRSSSSTRTCSSSPVDFWITNFMGLASCHGFARLTGENLVELVPGDLALLGATRTEGDNVGPLLDQRKLLVRCVGFGVLEHPGQGL